jgi:hypothetical protein
MTKAMGPDLIEEAKRNRKSRKDRDKAARKRVLARMAKLHRANKKKRTAAAKRAREIKRHGRPFFPGLQTVLARRAAARG